MSSRAGLECDATPEGRYRTRQQETDERSPGSAFLYDSAVARMARVTSAVVSISRPWNKRTVIGQLEESDVARRVRKLLDC